MLKYNSPAFFRFSVLYKIVILLCCLHTHCFVYGLDKQLIEIAVLLSKKHYNKAVPLLEKGVESNSDNQQIQVQYAFLITELPPSIRTKKDRYIYAYIAAQYKQGISNKERINLWIEAGDGFFNIGDLKIANDSYTTALRLVDSGKVKSGLKSYIEYKEAWIHINNKEWTKAFYLLRSAASDETSRIRENILADMGKVWAENQYSGTKIPFTKLHTVLSSSSEEDKKVLVKGIISGISRLVTVNSILPAGVIIESKHDFFIRLVSSLMDSNIFPSSCRIIGWIEKVNISQLDSKKVLSQLNSCAKNTLGFKKNQFNKNQIKQVIALYEQLKRTGVQRWPLILLYERLSWKKKACTESLWQLVDLIQDDKKSIIDSNQQVVSVAGNTKDKNLSKGIDDIKNSITESVRLCRTVKVDKVFSDQVLNIIFRSSKVAGIYSNIENSFEKSLFDLIISLSVKVDKYVSIATKQWSGKDLFTELFLDSSEQYTQDSVIDYLNILGSHNKKESYLDLLVVFDLPIEILQYWNPISLVTSYNQLIPWIKKTISTDKISDQQKQLIIQKITLYFPKKLEDRKEAALFLALNFLKKGDVVSISQSWSRIYFVFTSKALVQELFEQVFSQAQVNCVYIKNMFVAKIKKPPSVISFIYQACDLLVFSPFKPVPKKKVKSLKIPTALKSHRLAWDFLILNQFQNRTLWLRRNISMLKKKPVQLVTHLKKSLARHKKRRWESQLIQEKGKVLLDEQINLLKGELTKLAKTSPYGEKYHEIKEIVVQWM